MQQEIIPPGEPTHAEKEALLRQLELLADLMDSRFLLPGTTIRVGVDSIIGLIPVIGDTISALISGYIVHAAHALGVPGHVKARMGVNIFLDWLIGLVPFAGDAFDVAWKANRKNVALVRKWVERQGRI